MIRCRRCGIQAIRYHAKQERCFECEKEVAQLIATDARRNAARTWTAVDLTGRIAA